MVNESYDLIKIIIGTFLITSIKGCLYIFIPLYKYITDYMSLSYL